MKKCTFNVLMAGLLCMSFQAQSVTVFACEPEWAALAQAIGGDAVDVYSATTGMQDPHHVQARPSLIVKVRGADLLICSGAELEIGWLPILLKQSRNPRIQPGKPGYLMAAEQVDLLDKRETISRSDGDVHKAGNPHVQVSPERMRKIAVILKERLQQLDQANSAVYEKNWQAFDTRWHELITDLSDQLQKLEGKKVIVHHNTWGYLADWLGLDIAGSLEPKPGLPPTTSHLSSLVQLTQQQKIAGIFVASYQNPKGAQWLAEKTGLPIVILPMTVGGDEAATDLFAFYQVLAKRLQAINQ